MRAYEMHRYLRDSGLKFEREGGRHRIYSLGKNKVALPRGKNFRTSTKIIIDKFLKEHGVNGGSSDPKEDELIVPETACLNHDFEDNTTSLPPGLYEVYKDFVQFCGSNSDKAGQYEIRDIMLQNGYQLPDWNSLLYTAKQNEDVTVLFDLSDCLELMDIKSQQLQGMLDEMEQRTAPQERKMQDQDQTDDFSAAKVVAHGEHYQPGFQRSRPTPIIAPVQRSAQSEPPQHHPQTYHHEVPQAPSYSANGYSPRQAAYLEILPILGRLGPADAKLVLQQLNGFVELG